MVIFRLILYIRTFRKVNNFQIFFCYLGLTDKPIVTELTCGRSPLTDA